MYKEISADVDYFHLSNSEKGEEITFPHVLAGTLAPLNKNKEGKNAPLSSATWKRMVKIVARRHAIQKGKTYPRTDQM